MKIALILGSVLVAGSAVAFLGCPSAIPPLGKSAADRTNASQSPISPKVIRAIGYVEPIFGNPQAYLQG